MNRLTHRVISQACHYATPFADLSVYDYRVVAKAFQDVCLELQILWVLLIKRAGILHEVQVTCILPATRSES
jgi:hypothetical protein